MVQSYFPDCAEVISHEIQQYLTYTSKEKRDEHYHTSKNGETSALSDRPSYIFDGIASLADGFHDGIGVFLAAGLDIEHEIRLADI